MRRRRSSSGVLAFGTAASASSVAAASASSVARPSLIEVVLSLFVVVVVGKRWVGKWTESMRGESGEEDGWQG
jgi:hypothetical protein